MTMPPTDPEAGRRGAGSVDERRRIRSPMRQYPERMGITAHERSLLVSELAGFVRATVSIGDTRKAELLKMNAVYEQFREFVGRTMLRLIDDAYALGQMRVERDAARAEAAALREALASVVSCTTTKSGEDRRMIADGQGRAFSAAIVEAEHLMAARPGAAEAGGVDGE